MNPSVPERPAHSSTRETFGATSLAGVLCRTGEGFRLKSLAEEVLIKGDIISAAHYYASAAAAFRHSPPSDEAQKKTNLLHSADCMHHFGRCQVVLSKPTHAVAAFEEALTLRRQAGAPLEGIASLLEETISLHILNGDVPEAKTLSEELIETVKGFWSPDRPRFVRALFQSAHLSVMGEDMRTAHMTLGVICSEIARSSESDKRQMLSDIEQQIAALVMMNFYEEADGMIDFMDTLVQELGVIVDIHEISVEKLRSAAKLGKGDHEAATQAGEKALKLLETRYSKDNPQAIKSRESLANLYILGRNPQRAERLSSENLALLQGAEGKFPNNEIAEQCVNLAEIRLGNCKIKEAEELLEKARELSLGSGPELHAEISALSSSFLALHGKLDEALAEINTALEFLAEAQKKAALPAKQSGLLTRKFKLLLAMGNTDEAEEILEALEEDPGHIRLLPRRASSFTNSLRGDLADHRGLLQQAHDFYQEAFEELNLEKNKALQGTFMEVPFLWDLGQAKLEMGDPEGAKPLLERARMILDESGRASHFYKAMVLRGLIPAYEVLGLDQEKETAVAELGSTITELQFLNDGSVFIDDAGY